MSAHGAGWFAHFSFAFFYSCDRAVDQAPALHMHNHNAHLHSPTYISSCSRADDYCARIMATQQTTTTSAQTTGVPSVVELGRTRRDAKIVVVSTEVRLSFDTLVLFRWVPVLPV